VLYRRRPEPVRRAVTADVAAALRDFLRGAVEEGGTGGGARLATYSVLGKTGTAIRFENGRYVPGRYTASFAALFPADHPQLVVIVKLDDPQGNYYGGLVAAPVTRAMLQQALASHRVAIDRGRLARRDSVPAPTAPRDDPPAPVGAPVVAVGWPLQRADSAPAPRPVPDVTGRTVREAALALHRRGFRMKLQGMGRVVRTAPAAGHLARSGASVTVWAD
jgi:membrane peptidoglycan carboxypeptidase